jgi:hypothetical protein
MKASDLNKLLNDLSTGDNLKQAIQGEVASYRELMKKRGASIPLILDEDQEITLGSSAIKKLILETLSGRLSNVDLAYICDCLTLGEKVYYTNEKAKDIVFEIADPEINGGFKSDLELNQLIVRFNAS